MKKYQVPQIEEMMVEKLMNTPEGSGGGDTPNKTVPQRINKQFTV